MNPNEVIGKWAVEKGLSKCYHMPLIQDDEILRCSVCGLVAGDVEIVGDKWKNRDYSIYENIAPVLDKMREVCCGGFITDPYFSANEIIVEVVSGRTTNSKAIESYSDLPTTLRDMVAELISKGEV